MLKQWKGASVIKKLEKPILTKNDIPYAADLIFNAGVVKFQGKYVMVFRNDYGCDQEQYENGEKFQGTNLGVAYSDDGIVWKAEPKPWFELNEGDIIRVYDPRLQVIDDTLYICMAMDAHHGLHGAIARIKSFDEAPEILSVSVPDNRNMVLFPEKINGNFVRLERPMPIYSKAGTTGIYDMFDMWLSESPDLVYWGKSRLVMDVAMCDFANDKVGPAAPPIKTDKGWLTTFHAVERDPSRGKHGWEKTWTKVYHCGLVLLDLDDPSKIVGMYDEPLITSDMPYELDEGFRTDVIFPGGMILEDNGEVKIYYGAADTVECLATATLDDLLELCLKK